MSGERAKRFPLALEDLKRAPRKTAVRATERHPASPARPRTARPVPRIPRANPHWPARSR